MSEEHVNYRAISILSSRTLWLNIVAIIPMVLSLSEVAVLVPAKFMPWYTAILAVSNVILRLQTQRPAAFIMPGDTKTVQVKKIGPPPPGNVTD